LGNSENYRTLYLSFKITEFYKKKMDILDPFERILDITMALKELIETFKSKDKWFETCYIYFGSVIETITKYKENRNKNKKNP